MAARTYLIAAGLALGGCTAMIDRFSGRGEACAILAIGVPAQGTVLRLVDTGTTINDDPVIEFVLRVEPAAAPAYEARARALVGRLDVPAVQPGRVFPVRYDPGQPQRVAIDAWECD